MTPKEPTSDRSSATWLKSNLVALGSAAVLTVYAAGYMKTRAAAQRFAQEDLARQRPVPSMVAALAAEVMPAPPVSSAVSEIAPPPPAAVPIAGKASEPGTAKTQSTPAPVLPKTVAPDRNDSIPTSPQTKVAANVVETTLPKPTDSAATAKPDSAAPAEKPKSQWKDGTYKGYGTSRHGDIEAEVEIKGGRIVFAYISQCLTQYPCSVFDRVVPQVISRQGPEVDFVSGATQSVNAFYYAVVEALSKAK